MSTLGGKIDHVFNLKEQKRDLEAQVKALEEQIQLAESELIDAMDSQGVSKSTGRTATVSVQESVKPNVEDWDAFYAFIGRHKYYHLLERRPSVNGCRELFDTKGKIPGVVPFTKRSLSIRRIS